MNNITIKNMPFKLLDNAVEIGETIHFKARDKNNQDVMISDFKGQKIISIFPDIETKVCDMQTHELSVLAMNNPNINFISITMDDVEKINQWCSANGISNLTILSDHVHKEFGTKTRLLIPAINKLSRGFILLDNDDKVIDLSLNKELAEMPDFDKVNKWISMLK